MFGSTLYVIQTLLGDGMVVSLALKLLLVIALLDLTMLSIQSCIAATSFGSANCGLSHFLPSFYWVAQVRYSQLISSLRSAISCPLATGIGILYSFDKVVPQASIFVVQLGHWITAFFSMTFATNVICTGTSSLSTASPYMPVSCGCIPSSFGGVSHLDHQQEAPRLPPSQVTTSHAPHRRVRRALLRNTPRASHTLQCGLLVPVRRTRRDLGCRCKCSHFLRAMS